MFNQTLSDDAIKRDMMKEYMEERAKWAPDDFRDVAEVRTLPMTVRQYWALWMADDAPLNFEWQDK